MGMEPLTGRLPWKSASPLQRTPPLMGMLVLTGTVMLSGMLPAMLSAPSTMRLARVGKVPSTGSSVRTGTGGELQ